MTQPVRAHVLVLLIFGTIAALGLWLALGTYTRTESARGILATDQPSAKIVAIRPGQVIRLDVREGDYVRAGARIATIRTEQADASGTSPVRAGLARSKASARLRTGRRSWRGAAG